MADEFKGYDDCICDRQCFCDFWGSCILQDPKIKSLPPYMAEEIKNAKTDKKILRLLQSNKYFNEPENKQKDSETQGI